MKKLLMTIVVIIIIVILFILLYPFTINRFNDGGTVEYISIIYEVTKYHQLNPIGSDEMYTTGYKIKILGLTIYDKKN